MSVSDWKTSPSLNTDINGTNIAEGCPAGNVNGAIRELMASVRAELTDPVLSILGKATLEEIRAALDVPQGTAALDSVSGLTPAANRLAYYTGANTAALTPLTAFMRTLLDDADASSARDTLGAVGISTVQLSANGYVRFTHSLLPNGFTVQWGSFSPAGDSYQTISYPAQFNSFSRAVVSNAAEPGNNSGQQNGPGVTACSTTGFTVWTSANSNSTAFWIAVGV
jgi:hypothetical protein